MAENNQTNNTEDLNEKIKEKVKEEISEKVLKKVYPTGLVGWRKHLTVAIIGTVFAALLYYIMLPPVNPQSLQFWLYITLVMLPCILPYVVRFEKTGYVIQKTAAGKNKKPVQNVNIKFASKIRSKVLLGVIFVPVLVAAVAGLFSSTLFFATKYASVIEVKDSDFKTDLPETEDITQIALMDTESAQRLGTKALGSLSDVDVISQYRLSEYYTQINYKNTPQKVSNLEYDGFFKWLGNRKAGIPGMVMVDPVKNDAEYIKYQAPVYISESGYFWDDLYRSLRFSYPTKIFHSVSFEIDESGKPYYIVACEAATVGLFGAKDISEVIIFDPSTGKSEIMDVGNVPEWVDIVYTGDLACEKYNWHGTLSGGFFNSMIGKRGCKRSTDDFGYIALQNDVWYFTGVTSVSADSSNIGFILSNARTGEYKFYEVHGADEHSAMEAAEGHVQQTEYVASFPSLVNIAGEESYIMVLKDNSGIVKLYAIVRVENVTDVATGATQTEAMNAYKKKIAGLIETPPAETLPETSVIVKNVRLAAVGGETMVYITALDGKVYRGSLELDESLILIEAGDAIKIKYTETANSEIFGIAEWGRVTVSE